MHSGGSVWVEEILAAHSRIVVARDQILDDGQISELQAPASPLADVPDWPAKA